MLLLGLTGSIATGKSTVSNILRAPPYSLPIIDADVLARQVVEPGTPGYHAIVSHFLPTTPDLLVPASDCDGKEDGPDGKGRPLNRPALGRRVFGNDADKAKDRKVLNSIVHPAVRWAMYKAMLFAYLRGSWAVVLDIPLLYESGWETLCGTVMVVAVSDPDIQMKRLRERDPHLSAEDAENRVMSQTDVREKAERALHRSVKGSGVVVWNDGGKEDLKKELQRVMAEVRKQTPSWWTWLLLLCPPAGVLAGLFSFLRSRRMQKQWLEEKGREKAKL